MRHVVWGCATTLLVVSTTAQAITCKASIPLSRPDSRYEAVLGSTPTGSEVRDKVTGLVWQRCVMGMVWNGTTCTGTASSLTWVNALDAARTATASTVPNASAWRVPNHAELYSLAERACYNPAINTIWFPATPVAGMWSSSTSASDPQSAWLVYSYQGLDQVMAKTNIQRVRLVRFDQ